jgi:hypothetical protein
LRATGSNCLTATSTTIFQIRCRSAMAGMSAPGTNRWTVLRRELQSHCPPMA